MTTPRTLVRAFRWSAAGLVVGASLWLFVEVVGSGPNPENIPWRAHVLVKP